MVVLLVVSWCRIWVWRVGAKHVACGVSEW